MMNESDFPQDGAIRLSGSPIQEGGQEPVTAYRDEGVDPIPMPQIQPGQEMRLGGLMEVKSLDQMLADELAAADRENAEPMIQGLAAYIQHCWETARDAKEQTVEPRMFQSLRQRRGEYDPDLKAQLMNQGSALIYMMLTSHKCRSAAAWLREAMAGMPWSCEPTPIADVDPQTTAEIVTQATQTIQASIAMGYTPSIPEIKAYMLSVRDAALAKIQENAKGKAERMTRKMKDQMVEGGFEKAFDEFIDDLVTFPAACLKGPVVRQRPQLKWVPNGDGHMDVDIQQIYKLEWERVNPFDLYPAPDATSIDDGYLIERHKLSRTELVSLRGVEGYSEASINAVLDTYGRGGLQRMIQVDSERSLIEEKSNFPQENPSELIEALQFWGSVQGKLLIDWGMDPAEIDDPLNEYHIEAWLIGSYVIKATINPDPLHRKPYYKTSWESVPGCFWGHSVPDLCRDTQAMCNAAARAIANNMSLSSGPQVMVNSSRLPAGAEITEMYPWKIWEYTDDGYGTNLGSIAPINFFQPGSNANELMMIYQQFSVLADEYTGIPRYMTGDSATGGAGRTASGLSMLMGNAGKTIKSVVASVDRVLEPAIERLYFYNMQYLDDDDLKGDVNIVAKGASALVQKEVQQQKVNELFGLVLQSPVLQQLVGPQGVAYLFRAIVENIGIDTDKIVPAPEILKAQEAQMRALMAQQASGIMAQQQQENGQPAAGGSQAKDPNKPEGAQLMDGTPQRVDNE